MGGLYVAATLQALLYDAEMNIFNPSDKHFIKTQSKLTLTLPKAQLNIDAARAVRDVVTFKGDFRLSEEWGITLTSVS